VAVRGFTGKNTTKSSTYIPVARWTVNGQEREADAGDVFIAKAGEPHKFVGSDADPVHQTDIHLNAAFEQELLE
jgi:quercetin dioxygenase-like cupin family protein